MLFEIHNEGRIAYKRISAAELHRNGTSNMTHIGLSNESLTFMEDDKKEYSAMLIYKNFCDILRCDIGKITRKNGKKEAPKVSKGSRDPQNLVNQIVEFAKKSPQKDFYLLWFGLDSSTPVFWLIEEDSYDYNRLNEYCDFKSIGNSQIPILTRDNVFFPQLFQYVQDRLENVTIDLQKDLELSVEIDSDNPKFKDVEVKKAKSYIYELGKAGENLINEYLSIQKHKKEIQDYEWANRSGEQGKPYDFHITHMNGNQQWIDVKTTEHEFEQSIIVSKNEVKFITEKKNIEYAVFRVYSKKEIEAKLKVCSDCLAYMNKLYRDIDYMTRSMSDYGAAMVNYKIAVEPSDLSFKQISSEIRLPYVG